MAEKTYHEAFDRHAVAWTRSAGDDGHGVETSPLPDGGMAVRSSHDPDGPILFFTPAEWDAFVGGVQDGEFDI